MNKLDAIIRSAARSLALVGLLGLLVQALFTGADIVMRKIFSAPLDALSDVSELVVVFMSAACFPALFANRQHLSVDLLGKRLGWRSYRALELFAGIITLMVMTVIAWQVTLYALALWRSGETTWLIALPKWWAYAIVAPLMLACVPIQLVVLAMQVVRIGVPPSDDDDAAALAGSLERTAVATE